MLITGGVLSTTVMVNEALELLPAPSFAVTITNVVPGPKVVPEACE
jgi:hypothetical protein